MGNMSYCRFRNTLGDLQDCHEHIDDPLTGEENRARMNLILLCQDIASSFEDESREDLKIMFPDDDREDSEKDEDDE